MRRAEALFGQFMERGFNQGDLSIVDEHCAVDGVDHQEPPGTEYRQHLKAVIGEMRAAFPDLHFEIHQMMSEGDTVAFRSTMTGTHQGAFRGAPLQMTLQARIAFTRRGRLGSLLKA
jgi:predicted ester cyclase